MLLTGAARLRLLLWYKPRDSGRDSGLFEPASPPLAPAWLDAVATAALAATISPRRAALAVPILTSAPPPPPPPPLPPPSTCTTP